MFVLGRLIPAAFRAIFRMIFLGLLFAIVAGGVALAVSYANTPHWHWPPNTLTIVTVAAIALLAGYATALTTLVREVIQGVNGEMARVHPRGSSLNGLKIFRPGRRKCRSLPVTMVRPYRKAVAAM